MQVGGAQRGAERQPGAHQPPVHLHLVAAHEQPQVRHPDRVDRRRPEQRPVEQRGDARQQLAVGAVPVSAASVGPGPVPGQPAPHGERQPVGIVGVDHGRRDRGQPAPLRQLDQRGQHVLVGGPPVVVGQPDPVGAQGQRVQDAQREPAGPAQVVPGRQPGRRQPAGLDDLARRLVRPVVHHDQVRDRVRLLGQRGERVGQRPGPVPGDDHGDHRVRRQRSRGHRASISASTSRPL